MRVTAPQLRTVLLAQAIEHADSGHTLVSPPALDEISPRSKERTVHGYR